MPKKEGRTTTTTAQKKRNYKSLLCRIYSTETILRAQILCAEQRIPNSDTNLRFNRCERNHLALACVCYTIHTGKAFRIRYTQPELTMRQEAKKERK